MSFYRNLIAAVAAMGLASAVFAADTTNAAKSATTTKPAAAATAQQTADATPADKVNLNKATAKELAKVKGLSLNKSKAIVAYRKKQGDFKSVDDLKNVKGFKRMDEKTMKDIQEQLTVE